MAVDEGARRSNKGGSIMRTRALLGAGLAVVTAVGVMPPIAAAPGADVKITDRAYVRHDGGTDSS
ncbi:MAG: hypothetical protein ACRDJ0_15600, partial [Actinomycetota bacterium]